MWNDVVSHWFNVSGAYARNYGILCQTLSLDVWCVLRIDSLFDALLWSIGTMLMLVGLFSSWQRTLYLHLWSSSAEWCCMSCQLYHICYCTVRDVESPDSLVKKAKLATNISDCDKDWEMVSQNHWFPKPLVTRCSEDFIFAHRFHYYPHCNNLRFGLIIQFEFTTFHNENQVFSSSHDMNCEPCLSSLRLASQSSICVCAVNCCVSIISTCLYYSELHHLHQLLLWMSNVFPPFFMLLFLCLFLQIG